MYYASQKACKLPSDPKLAFCYDILNSVSRRCARARALAHARTHARKS
jgi:hypothetical protein